MTQKDALDQVFLTSNQLEVAINLDEGLVLTYMNWARRKVGCDTFPYRLDWYTVRGIDVIATPQLPIGILGDHPIRVLCTNPDDSSIIPARYVGTANEFWFSQKSGNPEVASNSRPMYFIGDDTTNYRKIKILPTTIVIATADIYKLPDDLATDQTDFNTDLGVPPGYDTAVVLGTLSRCYQKMVETDKMARMFKQYEAEIKGLEPAEYQEKLAQRNNLRALPLVTKKEPE